MLDSKDLELLRSMMQEVVSDSEARMTAKIEESEARMTAKIEESEARMTARIEERVEDTRSVLMAYLESCIEPQIRTVAEGHSSLQDTKASNFRVDRLEEQLDTHRSLIMALGTDVAKLKKAL